MYFFQKKPEFSGLFTNLKDFKKFSLCGSENDYFDDQEDSK